MIDVPTHLDAREASGHHEPNGPLWVEAAPFRSYARHLIEASGTSWELLAEVAQVRPSVLLTLLRGRDGRLRHRVPAGAAARLLKVRASDLRRAALRQPVAARPRQAA